MYTRSFPSPLPLARVVVRAPRFVGAFTIVCARARRVRQSSVRETRAHPSFELAPYLNRYPKRRRAPSPRAPTPRPSELARRELAHLDRPASRARRDARHVSRAVVAVARRVVPKAAAARSTATTRRRARAREARHRARDAED